MPKVSVFMPSYNHYEWVKLAIESVQHQTFQDFEIVVTDDGSIDGTPDIIEALNEPRLSLKRFGRNRGAAAATNDAILRCSGDYLTLLNSDDLMLPDKLRLQSAFLDDHPDIGAVFSRMIHVNEKTEPLHAEQVRNFSCNAENRTQDEWLHDLFYRGNLLCHPTVMIRRECYETLGRYDERLAQLPDYEMWIRLVSRYAIHVMPQALTAYRWLPRAANASAPRPDTILRTQWEETKVRKFYLNLPQQLFERVFAREIAQLGLDARGNRGLVLGRLCLAGSPANWQTPGLQRMGLELIFDALPRESSQDVYPGDFRHADFIREVGNKDVFNALPGHGIRQGTNAGHPQPLAVVDDFYPYPLSSFRFAEFNGLLDAFPAAAVYTSGSMLPTVGCNVELLEVIRAHVSSYPDHRNRVQPFRLGASLEGKAVYCVFLNIMTAILDTANRDRVPFVFTLYPGGGFELNAPGVDEKLKRIFGSPNFRKVIVTQPITREYLLAKGLCDKERMQFIRGGVLPVPDFASMSQKQLYGVHKRTVDVCFVAWRYTPQGRDKGYDTFIAVATLLARRFEFVHFHAVGPWNENDVDVSGLGERMHFHPPMFGELKTFFRRMDLILSPNIPFTIGPGKFDGFPTGCCVEAGLSGVAVCASDELKQNGSFTHGRDILITSVVASQIAEVVGDAISNYEGLTELGGRGQTIFSQVFGWAAQMGPRLAVLSHLQSLPSVPPVPAPCAVLPSYVPQRYVAPVAAASAGYELSPR